MQRFVIWPVSVLIIAATLSGCVDDIPEVSASRGDVRRAIAQGALKSPRPATLAFASLDGAPSDQSARFKAVFDKAAAERDLTIVDPKAARYLIRGYMSAAPGEHGTDVAFVYDIFDGAHRRVDRVADTITVPETASDPWAVVNDPVLTSLAGRSADGLAVALSGTPEAQAGQLASVEPPARLR